MAVGLVIVSHSAQLARGVAELAEQMAQGKTPIIAAGGAGSGNEEVLGTSVDTILAALQTIDAPDGILILLDMGSALLSTEMACDLLDDEQRSRVAITSAPLVEGAIAAAIEASIGHSLAEVKAAAEQTAHPQQLHQLKPVSEPENTPPGHPPAPPPTSPTPLASPPTPNASSSQRAHSVSLALKNPAGLHARPAGLFVQTASQFQASIQVQKNDQQVAATSLLGILSLSARQGDTITISANGPDAPQAIAALSDLVQAGFYETTDTQSTPSTGATISTQAAQALVPDAAVTPTQTIWHGISTSPGVALGPAYLYTSHSPTLATIERRTIAPEQVSAEQASLQTAIQTTVAELHMLAQELQLRIGASDAAIFDAHALILEDPLLLDAALDLIASQHLDAASALAQCAEEQAMLLQSLPDSTLAARAADVRDVAGRAIRHLQGQSFSESSVTAQSQPVILIARDLTPTDTAQLRPETVLGICTVQGGPTAHAAILARALGIPALAGVDEAMLSQVQPGAMLGLDAENGLLYTQLTEAQQQDLARRVTEQHQRQAALRSNAQQQHTPLIIGKKHIQLLANIGSESEATAAREWGAEGIGLLRTEFLFASTLTLPNVEEQRQRYIQVFQAFNKNDPTSRNRPITVRTLDAGADKPMPSLQAIIGPMNEANPALGLRGVRVHLAHQQLLEQQLTALLLAAADTGSNLHIMFPMITTVEELHTLRTLFTRIYRELQQQQVALPAHVPLGIMVEVPAAAIMATELAEQADFFSIGANDLLQYTLAADRTNTTLAPLYNPMQPAVLRLIRQIAQAGKHAGKPVAVCGEMASDPRLAPLLIGLGVTELSMTPTALPIVRAALAHHSGAEFRAFAQHVMHLPTATEVEAACITFSQTQ